VARGARRGSARAEEVAEALRDSEAFQIVREELLHEVERTVRLQVTTMARAELTPLANRLGAVEQAQAGQQAAIAGLQAEVVARGDRTEQMLTLLLERTAQPPAQPAPVANFQAPTQGGGGRGPQARPSHGWGPGDALYGPGAGSGAVRKRAARALDGESFPIDEAESSSEGFGSFGGQPPSSPGQGDGGFLRSSQSPGPGAAGSGNEC
jgi:hypothetical protein